MRYVLIRVKKNFGPGSKVVMIEHTYLFKNYFKTDDLFEIKEQFCKDFGIVVTRSDKFFLRIYRSLSEYRGDANVLGQV